MSESSPVLPSSAELLADPARLVTYSPVSDRHSQALDALLQEYQQLQFENTLRQAVSLFEKGGPRQLQRKSSWISRFFGQDIEREADYYLSCLQIDQLLETGDTQFRRLSVFISELEPLWRSVSQESELLHTYLDRYREVLAMLEKDPERLASFALSSATFPLATKDQESALDVLRRRQANLELQATVFGQTALQARLVLQSMGPLQEQWQKLRDNVVPLWRQNRILQAADHHLQAALSNPLSQLSTLMHTSTLPEEPQNAPQKS